MSDIAKLDYFIEEFHKNRFTKNAPNFPNILKSLSYNYSQNNNKNPSSQVLVKLISNLGSSGIKNCINYIVNNSNNDYCIDEFNQQKSIDEILNNWQYDYSFKKNAKEAWHLVFSVNDNKNSIDDILKSVSDTMQQNFIEYKYILVPHIHQNKPHIHVLLNKNNKFNNKKLHFKSKTHIKDFFFQLREDFKDNLNCYHTTKKFTNHNKIDCIDLQEKLTKEIELSYVQDSFYKNLSSSTKKLNNIQDKIPKIQAKIDSLETKRKEIQKSLDIFKEEDNINSAFFAKINEIKQVNIEYRTYLERIKELHTTKKKLLKSIDKLNYSIKNTSSLSLLNQIKYYKDYLEFKKNNSTLNKNDIENLRFIMANKQKIENLSEDSIKHTLILSKSTKRNLYHYINSITQITKTLNFLNENEIFDAKKQSFILDSLSQARDKLKANLESKKQFIFNSIDTHTKESNYSKETIKKLHYLTKDLRLLYKYGLIDSSELIANVDKIKLKTKDRNERANTTQHKQNIPIKSNKAITSKQSTTNRNHLRVLPLWHMATSKIGDKVLLHSNALHKLGIKRIADYRMRWTDKSNRRNVEPRTIHKRFNRR
ncbi:hypothetical protein CCY99_03455 [Helicobacter sp. 16-1353]|uniref:relaxase/mobilization nuclease domain-containing protein n=1 Tax=Helicobacter sp. 16-1353 TaxID=2004996 RepID=UPI000DCC1F47|nr:hypothetical protein [Helicobacter sp. 16-1353]RAX54422.1 hypothetical protein CCY99_03455 [Helicobacter sp. 16-1353]